MSEAEYLTNSVFSQLTNYVNSIQAERVSQRFSESIDWQEIKAGNVSYALANLLESQAEKLDLVKFDTYYSQTGVAENSLVSMHDLGTHFYALSELAKLLSLMQQMSASNSTLNQQVLQLEQAMAKCQNTLQLHKARSLDAESQLTQKTQELAAATEQVQYLSQELSAAHHNLQHQQIQIDTLTIQYQTSQERIAQMERECALTQANYNEQSHQLWETESTCRELRTRLARQQRQTMQLKVALEKCMEAPSNYQTEYSIQPDFSAQTSNSVSNPDSLLPKAEPISPWSAQSQFSNDESESAWAKFSSSPFTPQSSSFNWSTADLNTDLEEQAIASPDSLNETSSPQSCEEKDTVIDILIDSSSSLRKIELPKITTSPAEIYSATENISEAKNTEWQDLVDHLLETLEEPVTNPIANNAPEQVSPNQKTQFQSPESPQQNINFNTTNSNSPSPVVYPWHPSKQRKSLAAIELPNFNQPRTKGEGK